MKLIRYVLCVAAVAGLSAVGSATTIRLLPAPDVMGTFLDASYDGVSGVFTVAGYADSAIVFQTELPVFYAIDGGSFSLTAMVSNAGVASSGSLTISGCIAALAGSPGCSATPLLQSTVLSFFDFVPGVDGQLTLGFSFLTGDLSPLYRRLAYAQLNLIGFPGSFASSFSTSDFANVADVGTAIPEPSTNWLFLPAAGMVFYLRVQRRRG
jgi:hypothetical protein